MGMINFPPIKILVPVDFSQVSIIALKVAQKIAKVHGSEIAVLHVMEDPISSMILVYGRSNVSFPPIDRWEQWREEILLTSRKNMDQLLSCLNSRENIHSIFEWGKPPEKILSVGVENNFDLIVLSIQSCGRFKNLLKRSIGEEVIRKSSIPILIIGNSELKKDLIHKSTEFGWQFTRTYLKIVSAG